MQDTPRGTMDNLSVRGRLKTFNRPTEYVVRSKPQLFSDVTDSFMQVNQQKLDSNIPTNNNQTNIPVSVKQQTDIKQPIQQRTMPTSNTISQPIQPLQQNNVQPPTTQAIRYNYYQPPNQAFAIDANELDIENNSPAQPINNSIPNNNLVENVDLIPESTSKKSKKRYLLALTSIPAMALLIIGAVIMFQHLHLTNLVNAEQKTPNGSQAGSVSLSGQKSASSSGPSTTVPTSAQIKNYSVSPALPKYLIIPKLNVYSMVNPVSLTDTSLLGAPSNIYNIGWYQGSFQPGQNGLVILDGFVTNGLIKGPLNGLDSLKIGDTFQVINGEGTAFTYKIARTTLFTSTSDMSDALQPIDPTKKGLNIITCSGQVHTCPDVLNSDYVVFAEQL